MMTRRKESTYETEQKAFPTNLRNLMNDRKVSQTELSKIIGCTRQAVSLYATGQSTPDIDVLLKIAEYFEVSTDYLLGLTTVKTTNIDIRATSKLTGLSEKAIEQIEKITKPKSGGSDWIEINKVIDMKDFDKLLDADYYKKNIYFESTYILNYAFESDYFQKFFSSIQTLLDSYIKSKAKDDDNKFDYRLYKFLEDTRDLTTSIIEKLYEENKKYFNKTTELNNVITGENKNNCEKDDLK